MVDIARRVWNHKWKIDPIVRSLLDTDFYKLLMCQSIFRNKPDTSVTFSLINRSKNIKLAELIDEGELKEQLDHIRSLSLSRGESTWLRGIDNEESRIQVEALDKNAREFGVHYYPVSDIRQGIVHIVGPEQGWTLPGMTVYG